MVRVISVHHFTHQDVAGLDRAGYGVARGKGDYLFIGGEHKVDIRDLQNEGNIRGSFPTVDLVQQLVYCQKGNYVCTLESKPARHGGDHTYVRIYMNWEVENVNQPMRARIAGRVTPSGQSGLESLEMVEIPTKKPVDCIACCQTTGNVALACGMSLNIFKYCLKVHEVSKIKFIDFDEMIEIDMAFVIKEIAIAEDLIGCVSDTEAHIFQVVINNSLLKSSSEETQEPVSPENVARPKSSSKSKSRSESRSPGRASQCSMSQFKGQNVLQKETSMQLIRNADEYVDLSDIKWVPTMCYGKKNPSNANSKFLLFPSLVGPAQCGTVSDPGEFLGPMSVSQCSNVRIKFVSGHGSNQRVSVGIFDAITLLHRRVDQVSEPDLPFSNLKLLSIYDSDSSHKDHSPSPRNTSNPLLPSSSDKIKKVGATLFLTTPHIGYLYHVSLSQETKDISVVRGGVFSYTAPVDTVALESCLLHALTLTGLETYTLRPHPHVIESYLPGDQDMIVPAHWEESVCLVGLRPFLNVESLTLTDSCLALIAANDEGGDKSHTLYSLHLPSAGSLYKEMIRVGLSHHTASPPTYLHLLLEAHLVLITALRNGEQDNDAAGEDDLFSMLQDSSALLGDYYAGCQTQVEWNQAVQYYKGSSLTPDAIIERLSLNSAGLVHILSSLLMDDKTTTLSAAQANCILDILEKVAPHKVSTLVLKSNCFKEYKKDKVLNIIKQELSKTSDPEPTDVLALALIILERGSSEQVSSVLALLRSHQLCEILLLNSKILLDYQDGHLKLSSFAQVLMEHKRDVSMEVFVLMIGEGTLSLDAFVDAYVSVYPIMSCGIECNANSLRLRDLLENFFAEFGHIPELSPEKFRKSITVLVGLYIASLIGAFNFETDEEKLQTELRASRINLFEERPSYLNNLPPFMGQVPSPNCSLVGKGADGLAESSSSKEEGRGAPQTDCSSLLQETKKECNCRQCCLHLLVLQSLLSSDLPSLEDRATVLKFAVAHPEIKGSSSLHVLCLEPSEQCNFLLENHPKALFQYCKDTYESPWEWERVVSLLIENKNSLQNEEAKSLIIQDVLNEVLAELVMTAPFETFMEVLPKAYHDSYKLHLRHSHSAGIANFLKSAFTAYADNVLQQMAK